MNEVNIDHILNIVPIPGSENKKISSEKVSRYMADAELESLYKEPAETLKPLFIDEEMIRSMKSNNYRDFFEGRAKLIAEYVNKL